MTHLTLSSGDPSSDVYAASAIAHIKKRFKNLKIGGIGGPKMRSIIPTFWDQSPLSIIGLDGLWSRIFGIWKLLRLMKKRAQTLPAHRVVLMDCSGFHLRLLGYFKKHRVIYAIPPQIWAWNFKRIQRLKSCQEVWILYPFEAEIYQKYHIPARLLRHPLIDLPHLQARPLLAMSSKPVIALLPGSRSMEHHRLMPILIALTQQRPDIEWIWVENQFDGLKSWHATMPGKRVLGLANLPSVHLAIACSGTVTLELGLMNIPMMIIYRMSYLSAYLARRLLSIPHVGLPNILLKRGVCPELLQEKCNTSNLILEIQNMLSANKREQQFLALQSLRSLLDQASKDSFTELLEQVLSQDAACGLQD